MNLKITFLLIISILQFNVINAQRLTIEGGPISRYMAHGVDVGLADQEAFQLGIYKPLPFHLNFVIWSSFAVDRKYDNLDEVNLLLKWSKSYWDDSRFQIILNCYIDYWFYHGIKMTADINGNAIEKMILQGNKANFGFSLPSLIKLYGKPLIISYDYFYWIPLFEKTFSKGGIHEFKLDYGLPLQFETKRQILKIGTSTNYSEKNILQPYSGWTNLALHISTKIISETWTLSPSIHYQWTWKKSINKENEFWFGFTIGKSYK
ncbi:hypothetical protein GM418_25870 [Maribellus comscasis]|uniref:Uncharacterized protein n=1 Tax=Maribellus comscasis TaxID=2681766 RepID=A0A6I6K5R1_9BACT|nr:hypothetical protein [Maribellus comscasis]QGY46963.1 hypothetical protein GM418_25870 [Maribellus comscasis]